MNNSVNVYTFGDDLYVSFDDYSKLKKDYLILSRFNADIRLEQTKKVFEALAGFVINGSCSYRYLIYNELGFSPENYSDLDAGMTITNAIAELEEMKRDYE